MPKITQCTNMKPHSIKVMKTSQQSNSQVLNVHETALLKLVVGPVNFKRWLNLKRILGCKSNEAFVTKLLEIAEKFLSSNFGKKLIQSKEKTELMLTLLNDKNTEQKLKDAVPELKVLQIKDNKSLNKENEVEEVHDKSDLSKNKKPCNSRRISSEALSPSAKQPKIQETNTIAKVTHQTETKRIRKNSNNLKENSENSDTLSDINKPKLCDNCDTRHKDDNCPLKQQLVKILDSINLKVWKEKFKSVYNNEAKEQSDKDGDLNENSYSYSRLSLPSGLKFFNTKTEHGIGVIAKKQIQQYSEFGPLIGKIVKAVDIQDDSNMRDMWEIILDDTNIYICTDDFTQSNWMRYIRPAPTRDDRNLTVIIRDDNLYFVSIKCLNEGDELLYWQDSSNFGTKKKMAKSICGGCNMTFAHPLYYRVHCSIFHDPRCSLTLRKYYCKVCGEAILGKENIIKHAMDLHNGDGAYQCQFCRKFFLRLNYLEMHRNYGCSANPHRARPLCDFCGKKFCQPQKLKNHIKRMHSNSMTEVLKEFQCKVCMRILGSRAALQRHEKEVHQKQGESTCSCLRCGKSFQNKSNLKIHMLTHSGIKPFQCQENKCNAAFTTKQCLQNHYKKVHNYTEENMPKIIRSVDYTFQAYSGLELDDGMDNLDLDLDDKTKIDNLDEVGSEGHDNYQKEDEISVDLDNASMDSKDADDSRAPVQSPFNLKDQSLSSPAQRPSVIPSPPPLILIPVPPSESISSPPTPPGPPQPPPPPPSIPSPPPTSQPESPLALSSRPQFHTSIPVSVEQYTNHLTPAVKVLSKGSKKWISEEIPLTTLKASDFYTIERLSKDDLNIDDHTLYDRKLINISEFQRHEPSNASLLVEAALDSVCNEPNMDIDVGADGAATAVTTSCHDSLVNNLYTLATTANHNSDELAEVNYNIDESRDLSLMSPSVNDHISVTDELDNELRQNQNIGMDYSNFHHHHDSHHPDDFSPPDNSPNSLQRANMVKNYIDSLSLVGVAGGNHNDCEGLAKLSPESSPPRYNFSATSYNNNNNNMNVENLSSDESNGMAAQNLSLHTIKNDIQLDLSMYKAPYKLTTDYFRRIKFEGEIPSANSLSSSLEPDVDIVQDMSNGFQDKDDRIKGHDDLSAEIRSKFELDLDLKLKNYESNFESELLRQRSVYDVTSADLDFRTKNYDLIETALDNRMAAVENDFRTERNFEPIVLNSSEHQGLDMSARSFHNYSNINRYHHLYPEVDRVDIRLNYSSPPPAPPPPAPYDLMRAAAAAVSLDLTPPGRHNVELSIRNHPLHQLTNTRLLTDHTLSSNHRLLEQSRLVNDFTTSRLGESRLLSETSSRLLSDHTTNRILSNTDHLIGSEPGRLLSDDSRLLADQSKLLVVDQQRSILSDSRLLSTSNGVVGGSVSGGSSMSPPSPVAAPPPPSLTTAFGPYSSMTQTPYHPTPLAPRSHMTSPTNAGYHHPYPTYYPQ